MRKHWLLCGLLMCALFAVAVSPATALVMVLDEETCSYVGSWTYANTGDVPDFAMQGDERYNFSPTASATWTPAVAGVYDLQAHWFAWDHATSPHAAQATYTINHVGGATQVTVDQRQIAAQGNPGSLGNPGLGQGWGSGWYTLGQFELDPSSTVVLTNTGGTGALCADALRVSDEGIIIDEYSANATYAGGTWYFPRAFSSNVADESTQYTHKYGGGDMVTYTATTTGPVKLNVSWPAHSAHSDTARYTITDAAGIVRTVDVDERLMADQVSAPSAEPQWSGWHNAGWVNLGPGSTIVLSEPGGAGGALAADALMVKPLSGYPAQPVGSNAVGYWRLGDDAGATTAVNKGAAGATLDGTYSAAKVSAAGLLAGDPDTAADFDGASRFVQGAGLSTAGPGGTNVFAGDWTIEAWFVRDTATFGAGVFSNSTSTTDSSAPILTFIEDTNRIGIMNPLVSWGNISLDLGDHLDKPVYVAMTKTGANNDAEINIYANVGGEWLTPVLDQTLSWALVPRDGFFIGRHYYGPDHRFDGTMDEVALYANALSWGDVKAHYYAGVPEPATMLLLAGGCLALVRRRRRS